MFLLADYGYPSYGAIVLAPQATIDSKPAMVRAFVEASVQGWHDYLHGDNRAANAMIKQANPDETDDVIAYGIAKMQQYELAEGGDAKTGSIGAMTDARWRQFFDIMVAAKVYPASLDYKQAYTLAFLPKH